MRIKYYTAETMAEAMDLVRNELGDKALIVSTQRNLSGPGIKITAAVDDEFTETIPNATQEAALDDVRELLKWHNASAAAINTLVNAKVGGEGVYGFLVAAIEKTVKFQPIAARQPEAIMLIGPTGAGKTLTVTKLAARFRIAGLRPALLSADCVKAGAIAQLQAFADILDAPLLRVKTAEELAVRTIESLKTYDIVLIDTPSFNPLNVEEVDAIAQYARLPEVEPVLTLPAGLDTDELTDQLQVYEALNVKRMILTKLDTARRQGAVIQAALKFAVAELGNSSSVAGGLVTPNPSLFAEMLCPHTKNTFQTLEV